MAVLDTTALIDLTRRTGSPNRARVETIVQDLVRAGETLCTSRLNEAEFRVGIFRSRDRAKELKRVDALLSTLIILEFDAAAALHYARMTAHLLNAGTPAGDMDVLIAAVALANGHAVVTRNPNHFVHIPRLQVLRY